MRERRRAETVGEIKDAALTQMAEAGAGSLSLRAVARSVGMTVQSLYHYFDSREALLTALVFDAHHDLAAAVQSAADSTRGRPPRDRRMATTGAYRAWALAHRSAFLLIYGTPVPGFEPLPDSDTVSAALRLAEPFIDTVFDGWTPAELAAIPIPQGGESLADLDYPHIPLPPGALAYFVELWAGMHGLVVLHLLGHLFPFNDDGAALYAAAMRRVSDGIDALRAQVAPAVAGGP